MNKSELWEELLDLVTIGMDLNEQEFDMLDKSKLAKLLGAAPYLAKCENPKRLSVLWVSMFVIGQRLKKEGVFDSKPNDFDKFNIWKRFFPALECNSGDRTILNKIKKRILLCSMADHRNDIEKDKEVGKFNPFATKEQADQLIDVYVKEQDPDPEIDAIMSVEYASRGLWN
jgi:hypothetical protein